ncbi:hypothetical protein EKE94_15645 [Mesobaculum littorinae]|uniref:Uncharacterized protein n=1 Tax=Mesobaculum littorinae TaxID=2486419 RepID=A0A438AEG8_9RHOB|nr:hypothetical protein [Mesobaculum littorinae]RVV97090.1 hypothetical protein EKE94_15645 [Mesobaculum littorinae]
MVKIIHPVAGGIALLTIAIFWLATALGELFGSVSTIVAIKSAIPWGFLLLIPALAATGGTGFNLAKGRRPKLITTKIKRTAACAANGLLVLVPSAVFLAFKARAGELDAVFYAIQALELIAGAANITLLGLNMRDGLKMTGRFRRRANARPATNKRA